MVVSLVGVGCCKVEQPVFFTRFRELTGWFSAGRYFDCVNRKVGWAAIAFVAAGDGHQSGKQTEGDQDGFERC